MVFLAGNKHAGRKRLLNVLRQENGYSHRIRIDQRLFIALAVENSAGFLHTPVGIAATQSHDTRVLPAEGRKACTEGSSQRVDGLRPTLGV